MKIEWVDDDFLEAVITRGWWRWKEVARVEFRLADKGNESDWYFVSGDRCPWELKTAINNARRDEVDRRARQKIERNWARATEIPEARVVSG